MHEATQYTALKLNNGMGKSSIILGDTSMNTVTGKWECMKPHITPSLNSISQHPAWQHHALTQHMERTKNVTKSPDFISAQSTHYAEKCCEHSTERTRRIWKSCHPFRLTAGWIHTIRWNRVGSKQCPWDQKTCLLCNFALSVFALPVLCHTHNSYKHTNRSGGMRGG